MFKNSHLQLKAPEDWKTPLAVLGAVTAGFLGAKLLRQILVCAQHSLLPPVVRKYGGEWALITGGSEGIGKAVAAELASYGLNVVLVSRSQDKLDAAADEIKQKHPAVQVRTYFTDLTDASSYSKLLQHLSDNKLHISLLVANAGGVPSATALRPYWAIPEYDLTQIRLLNGDSCYNLVRGLIVPMMLAGKGAVVCISSMASLMPVKSAAYGAEKAKVNKLCQCLDADLHGTGVTAQAMVLGGVITPAIQRFLQPGSSSALKPTTFAPSAETAAAAIVRSIGRGGPIVIPYWSHALLGWLLLGWWPPELQTAMLGVYPWIYRSPEVQHHKKTT